jgi:hypothetical protein
VRTSFRAVVIYLFTGFSFEASVGPTSPAAPVPAVQSNATETGNHPGKSRPTPQEIADAKAKNLVWVNTATRVYHKTTSPRYGTTERGKFMSEEEAKKSGYRIADESRSQRTPRATTTEKQ